FILLLVMTKSNRLHRYFPKSHVFDAACVGRSTPHLILIQLSYVQIFQALGRGTRQMARVNQSGFPLGHRTRRKQVYGFQTSDLVVADVPRGKYQGQWRGRVAIRASGYFDLKDLSGSRLCQGISHRYCRILQHADGWYYAQRLLTRPIDETVLLSPD
ncbi:MAG: hypothetical protein ACFFDI_28595, partial [Promethearchaeota archaeon]